VRLAGEDAARASHGVAVGRSDTLDAPTVLLRDDVGPIAVAEPRDGAWKPVVGFRA
jgi:hypothetical protein